MNFNYSEEQVALQDTLRRFLGRQYSFEQRRAILVSAPGFSREVWRQLADIGLLALPLAQGHGGLGGTPVDTMIVMEALGRGLVLEPYLASVVLAGSVIAAAGALEQSIPLLTALGSGERLFALAHCEAGARYDTCHVATIAKADGDDFVLSGHKVVVIGAPQADTLIVAARSSGKVGDSAGVSLFQVDAKGSGVRMSAYATQDNARAADIRFDQVRVPATALLGALNESTPAIDYAFDIAGAALVAETVGIMTALNEVTLEYLKTRKQFGLPIGKFQALQHRMAEMIIAAEHARSMAILAAIQVQSPDAATRSRAVAGARAFVGEAARHVGQEAVQMHGGMGVVDEHIVSHYFKRLTVIEGTFGDTDYHLGRFSATLLDS